MLPRNSSHVLTFKLREFFDHTSDHTVDWNAAMETTTRPRATSCADADLPPPLPSCKEVEETRVWVDCFFYGFYIDEKDAASFQQPASKPSILTPP